MIAPLAPGNRVQFAAWYVAQYPHTVTWAGTVVEADLSTVLVRWDVGREGRYFIDKLVRSYDKE